jgi:tetratricopeptide (TPR) repeat protein
VTPEPQPEELRAYREEAFEHLNLALNNSSFQSHYTPGSVRLNVGILNMRLGRLALARQQLQLCVKELPQKAVWNALIALAELDLEEGHTQEALENTKQAAVAAGSANPRILYWMGRVYEKLGDKETALRAYRAIPPQNLVGPAAGKRIEHLTLER